MIILYNDLNNEMGQQMVSRAGALKWYKNKEQQTYPLSFLSFIFDTS